MKLLRVAIYGAHGRMGVATYNALQSFSHSQYKLSLTSVFEHNAHPLLGSSFLTLPIKLRSCATLQDKENFDVLIDFSGKHGTSDLVNHIKKPNYSLIVGSTMISDKTKLKLKSISKYTKVLISSNMSLGVAVLERNLTMISSILQDMASISIHDTHHIHKIDAPSGTALSLLGAVNRGLQVPRSPLIAKFGKNKPLSKKEISIAIERVGEVIGDHSVSFYFGHEKITLTHQAFDRSVFAEGALFAATKLHTKKNGWFSLADLIL
ncbi:MAG: 4-hydroxy-tetrahydrodipicolinate reductase [Methylacidiphilales bacterium]|nr:4-hydroxy-tetrahydrodipicolinate reductase [Candidatus Methylacidiphilales bacterium]